MATPSSGLVAGMVNLPLVFVRSAGHLQGCPDSILEVDIELHQTTRGAGDQGHATFSRLHSRLESATSDVHLVVFPLKAHKYLLERTWLIQTSRDDVHP